MAKGGDDDFGAFYPVRPECESNLPKTRFKPRAGKTLSARRWHAAFSDDGHLDMAKVLRRIQRGGVHPAIKGAVWEFLLGCFDPNSTFDERNQLREERREQYSRWEQECRNMVPVIGSGKFITTPIITDDGQPIIDPSTNIGGHVSSSISDKKVIQWMLSLHQIGLDVVRTDQAMVFYQNESNQAKLWDVLAVYSWMDNDISYVQGMNDICSPIVVLLENEADAFWCFDRAMRRLVAQQVHWLVNRLGTPNSPTCETFYRFSVVISMLLSCLGGVLGEVHHRENFRCSTSSIGVQTQLSTLSQVIKTIDPKLHQHLEDLDGGEYLFAFRMLMVLFRREFSFADSLYLWELMWAMEYNPNIFSIYDEANATTDKSTQPVMSSKLLKQCGKFEQKNMKTGYTDQSTALAIFLVAGVLEAKNKRIIKEAKGLDDVVQILGDITGNLDAKKVCTEALKIHKKYLSKAKKS